MNEAIGVAVIAAYVVSLTWLYGRKTDWWKGGRPVSQITFINATTRIGLAYVPMVGLVVVVLGVGNRIGGALKLDWVGWLAIVLAVGLLLSVVFLRRPRFLLPPGYLRAYSRLDGKRHDGANV